MKILLVEDEPGVADFLKRGLEEEYCHVEHALDGERGEELALSNHFDIIILDLILPGKNGLEVCKSLRKSGLKTPVIILTALGSTEDIITGLDSGADDYLKKPFRFKELMARIRALMRRGSSTKVSDQLGLLDLQMDLVSKEVRRGGRLLQLTAREFALLEYLLRNQKRVVSRIDILENVWDISFNPGTNVVDVYINYLRNKVDKPFPEKLIHTVVGMGFIMREEE